MADVRLPKDVVAKVERRWAARLQQDARAWSSGKAIGGQSTNQIVRDGLRSIPTTIKRARLKTLPVRA